MWKTGSISIPEFLQPNDEAWGGINNFAEKWNEANSNFQLKNDHGNSWYITLGKDMFHIYPTIVRALKELEDKVGIYYVAYSEKNYEEEDFLNTAFTEFASRPIESKTPFIINEKEITPTGGDCPKCGSWSPLMHTTKSPLIIIDESLLKNPMDDLTKPADEEWDITTAQSHYLISARFKKILAENDIKGYSLLPTIDHKTGKESEKMYQLLANKATNISALPEGITSQPFCDSCGAASEIYDFDFAVSKEWIGTADFFARSSYRGTNLHMSKRVFRLVRQHQLTGLWPLYAVAAI